MATKGTGSGTTTTTGRGPDWPLRRALAVALTALVLMALIVTVTRSPTKAATPVISHPGHPKPRPTSPATPTATTVPGADSGPVTRAALSGACGLSLRGKTTVATSRTAHSAGVGATAPVPAPVGKCTVLEIGDSIGNDIGWGLLRHLAPKSGLDLVQLDKSATGLANTTGYDWSAELANDLRTTHPQLVLICLGGNDQQGIQLASAAVQFPTAAWKVAYLARVRAMVRQAAASGAYVLWIGLPIMGQPGYSQGAETLDALYQQVVTSEPNATFVPTWSLFSNPHGAFQSNAEVNGTATTLRESDGVHYSFAGEDVIATYVLREMALIYHVRLAPTSPAVITGW